MSPHGELGDYRLGRRIAVGGMAEIFEATRRDGSGPPLVLKRLLPQYAKDAEVVRMLEHEGELVRRLVHPRLVRVIDVVARGEEPFLVLERIDGVSADVLVDALADREEPCTLAMALALVLPLLDALAFVHEAEDDDGAPLGIVHRDVTPHNVLVSRDGTVKLGDFGIARSSLRDARTRTGVIKGKLRYLAPEQVTGSALDARTDIYAVGALLFELLAGEPYLRGSSEVELLRAAEESRYRSLGELSPGLDPRVDKILQRCLSRFVEQRPKRAATLRDELRALVDDAQLEEGRAAWARLVGELAPPVREATDERPAAPVGAARRTERIVGAVLLVALAGAGLSTLYRGRDETPVSPPTVATSAVPEPTAPEPAVELPRSPASDDVSATTVPIDGPDEEPETAPETGPSRPEPSRAERAPRGAVTPPSPEVDVPEPSAAPELARARAELDALRRELATRGVLESDLSADQRRDLGSAEEALDRSEPEAARRALDSVAPQLRAITVNEPFVRAKLERVDARIRAARAAGLDTREVERIGALALQDLLERRPDATNRRLNEILARLGRR